MENLLAYVEFCHFERFVMDLDGCTVCFEDEDDLIEFPENIPLSFIVEEQKNENEVMDVTVKAHLLFNKYVASNSELEINIPGRVRQNVSRRLRDLNGLLSDERMDLKVLCRIFVECKEECYRLLLSSYMRFIGQPEYDEMRENGMSEMLLLER